MIVGGRITFALVSIFAIFNPSPLVLALVRLGQGAAASAFSPASSSAVARLAGKERLGRYFGKYGAWKSIGYVVGPLAGVALVYAWGIEALYVALAALAAVAAAWCFVSMPAIPILSRRRYTVVDLLRQTTERGFIVPTSRPDLAARSGSSAASLASS